jgi:cyanophycinase
VRGVSVSFFFFFLFCSAATASADLVRYWTGNAEDVRPRLYGPVLMLVGGGGDSTAGLQEAIDRIRGCRDCNAKVDVVVLRASGAEGYNPYFMAMNGVDSVLSMVITDRETSSRPDVVAAVRDAEVIYFAGGDQCNYIRWIKGTPVAEAVKQVYHRGGAIGGTSAGLAVQGEIVYDACPSQSAQSKAVLADPHHVDVSLSRGFFSWPEMRGVITDTHFQQRDRLGRLVTFLARSYEGRPLRGLGVSEGTVVLVGRKGAAKVFGKGPVHLIRGDAPSRVEAGQPLQYSGLRVWRFESGEVFSLQKWPEKTPKTIDVVDGKLSADPY